MELIEYGVLFRSIVGVQRLKQERGMASARGQKSERGCGDVFVRVAGKWRCVRNAFPLMIIALVVEDIEALEYDFRRSLLQLLPHFGRGIFTLGENGPDDCGFQLVGLCKLCSELLQGSGSGEFGKCRHSCCADKSVGVLDFRSDLCFERGDFALLDCFECRRADAPAWVVELLCEAAFQVAVLAFTQCFER